MFLLVFLKNKKLLYIEHLCCLAPWNVDNNIAISQMGKLYIDRFSSLPNAAPPVRTKSRAASIPVVCYTSNLVSIISYSHIIIFFLNAIYLKHCISYTLVSSEGGIQFIFDTMKSFQVDPFLVCPQGLCHCIV